MVCYFEERTKMTVICKQSAQKNICTQERWSKWAFYVITQQGILWFLQVI